MLVVAHRAGNEVGALRRALDAGADLIEADVRYFRGVPEIRHRKTLGPRLLWDHPWELVRRSRTAVPTLDDVLAALDGDPRLMLDLKGNDPRLAPAVARRLRHAAPTAPIAVCTRNWRMLDAFAGNTAVRTVISAGSQREFTRLRAVLRTKPDRWPGRRQAFGVSVRRTLLTSGLVAELHRAVDHVLAWPVDTREQLADAVRLGVSGVTGKDVALLAAAVP
jgi:glycerophosphoryl diester phosphodiesterase